MDLAHVAITDLLRAARNRGAELARLAYRRSATPKARQELAITFGIEEARAGQWIAVGKHLYATHENPTENAHRQDAAHLADTNGYSIDALTVINTALRRLRAAPIEATRATILRAAIGKSVTEIRVLARNIIHELNSDAPLGPVPERRYLRISAAPDAHGMRYATMCLPDSQMQALIRKLEPVARELMKEQPQLRHQQALLDALCRNIGGGVHPNQWLRQAAILITMDDLESRGDGTYATTDGALITPAEYASQKLTPHGLCLVYDKNAEPVDLFRTARHANSKQRAILSLDQLLCSYSSCSRSAENGQAHHIKAWQYGGETNLANLAPACKQHNSWNDDNPDAPPHNGRIVKHPITGEGCWLRPDATSPRLNYFPIKNKSGRRWATRKVGREIVDA
ncbi:HNH endonuclease signature motif containing protein [Corynebacterium caspium]|uniref:HNH endonuclease signature motif containing protein n=1 Tax=Corynebacterium caspium TaxID=234828 RepID=UPI000368CD41|nr:HNH endonuclease signature motif containing protein [Corynebacterium caspium]WKD59732.1 hypothetical protein CCASP_06765 [Corynebacterium caspium DSM 44850]